LLLALEQAARRFEPVDVRHADVHEDDVRLELGRSRERLRAVGGLAHDVHVFLGLEDHPETGPDEGLVVHDEDANHEGTSPIGRRARTT
jgi:hypothetical protein